MGDGAVVRPGKWNRIVVTVGPLPQAKTSSNVGASSSSSISYSGAALAGMGQGSDDDYDDDDEHLSHGSRGSLSRQHVAAASLRAVTTYINSKKCSVVNSLEEGDRKHRW